MLNPSDKALVAVTASCHGGMWKRNCPPSRVLVLVVVVPFRAGSLESPQRSDSCTVEMWGRGVAPVTVRDCVCSDRKKEAGWGLLGKSLGLK